MEMIEVAEPKSPGGGVGPDIISLTTNPQDDVETEQTDCPQSLDFWFTSR